MVFEEKDGYVTFNLNSKCKLIAIYRKLFEIGALFDVIFTTDTNDIHKKLTIGAHRKVLSTYSSYFRKLFESQSSGSFPLIIAVNSEDFIRLNTLISLIYGQTVSVTKHEFSNTLNLAFILGIKPLKKMKNLSFSSDSSIASNSDSKSNEAQRVNTTTIEVAEDVEDNIPATISDERDEQDSLIPGSDCEDAPDEHFNCVDVLKNIFRGKFTSSSTHSNANVTESSKSAVACRSHQCCHCDKTYAYKHTLIRHQRAIHLLNKFCGQTFTWDQQLRRHTKRHSAHVQQTESQ
ncbi:hypothetical protein B4U80_14062 [Leptotrombidium deliense]|uniref:BTB domain-containing protein n=1 Tax=Leptotrombidium deliense TaxID=299467 RepID=A0A443S3U4_9ACAR|nr:hypothetical protein B4U80_14062 [Leptotrombidium deliense]